MECREGLTLCEIQERLNFLAEKNQDRDLQLLSDELERFEDNHPELVDSL